MQAQLNPRIINILLKQQSELHKNNLDGKHLCYLKILA